MLAIYHLKLHSTHIHKKGKFSIVHIYLFYNLFSIHPPPGLLPELGLLERYMTPTLDSALLCCSRAGADLGRASDGLSSFDCINHLFV